MSETWKVRMPKLARIMSSMPATKASENMPACSTPTSWVMMIVRRGKTMPNDVTPAVFHM